MEYVAAISRSKSYIHISEELSGAASLNHQKENGDTRAVYNTFWGWLQLMLTKS